MWPIGTDNPPRRTPYANYALILLNVVIFLYSSYGGPHRYLIGGEMVSIPIHPRMAHWLLIPAAWRFHEFLTYAFLHGSMLHIFGNMLFLYLFGNSINDKLGNFWYTLFYLGGAVFSGVGHTLMHLDSYAPTLGASGAVAAVTGAYLVLYPQTLITVLYWFFFIGTIRIPALYFIGIKMILIDNMLVRATRDVAYDAHLAGYAYGILIPLVLLAARLVETSHLDLWSMIRRWDRRRRYRDVVADGYDPFTGAGGRRRVAVREVPTPADERRQAQVDRIRHEIGQRVAQRNLAAAADSYLELMRVDPEQVLPRQSLLDIANQLAEDRRAAEAAGAYEQFLTHYGNYEYAEQVELMVGILYSRYLHDSERAIRHLRRAAERLSDDEQLRMCRLELARLESSQA
ncbi:MAG TPA: rhomboid family intramembrane serine protease [Sedimentisphaerales bacterium]|jgi:membrane associated rhomboid family serine protease|nr:rhomboid family intramembrane serine protease [Sedimentisphaerales bacterium]HNU28198.1 rhomboid family intramembrane serine protease [Sedimentisphaerales bacterium]